nr:MAG TPA: hypothetical protein [Caudoviricetes sp.]
MKYTLDLYQNAFVLCINSLATKIRLIRFY